MSLMRIIALAILAITPATIASAQAVFPLTITGNKAEVTITLPGDVGADLTIAFEQAVGLNTEALEVAASVISPLNASILSRLPGGAAASIPTAFPIVVRIEPTPTSALSFSGVVTVSLHTHNLSLLPNSILGLYSASAGGPFREITAQVGIGSYRVNGSGPGFSEFLVAADSRPVDAIIAAGFDTLGNNLAEHAASMPALVSSDLEGRLAQARNRFEAGLTADAIKELGGFADVVKAQSGAGIPDVWRAHDTRVNVAGLLRSGADVVKFNLNRKASQ